MSITLFCVKVVVAANEENNDCSPASNASDDFSTANHYESLRDTLQQIDIIHTLIERYPDSLGLARTSAEVWDAFRSGRVASLIGVEGLHQIANSASVMRSFYRLGVRYITLTHDSNNLASLTQHPRNSPDEVLDMLKANGGVFMISFLCKLTDSSGPTLKRVADHIQHAGERIGYDHVGIGSDFDGMMDSPSGLEDISKMPFLVAELLKRGIPEDSVQNIVGLNVLRVLDAVQEVSARMRNGNQDMLQDVIDEIWDEHVRLQVKQVRGLLSPDDDSFISTQKGSVDAIRTSD
ncbi:Peptidase M19, renal dipeptidase [Metarhizium rileyi]|uniref:Dipeptidase n=1 Tax=Metarhizium rileyi (strain RCEF 4871) TaxID=1649241 RepID=A0A167CK59_METRR|nr:Peptidase M19, renal dipeptidase [Metarhizium rileyi RCEF 4871]